MNATECSNIILWRSISPFAWRNQIFSVRTAVSRSKFEPSTSWSSPERHRSVTTIYHRYGYKATSVESGCENRISSSKKTSFFFWFVMRMPSFMLFRVSVVALSIDLLTPETNSKTKSENPYTEKPINQIPSCVSGNWPAISLNGRKFNRVQRNWKMGTVLSPWQH